MKTERVNIVRKVAWMGAHSSAKTTTVNRVAVLLADLDIDCHIISEVARDCPFPISEEGSALAQMWMIAEQITRETTYSGIDTIVLCDRSIWDYYAYSLQLHEDGRLTRQELVAIRDLCRKHSDNNPYHSIYFCEPKPLYEDGVRSVDPTWRQKVYEKFKRVIKEEALAVTIVQ